MKEDKKREVHKNRRNGKEMEQSEKINAVFSLATHTHTRAHARTHVFVLLEGSTGCGVPHPPCPTYLSSSLLQQILILQHRLLHILQELCTVKRGEGRGGEERGTERREWEGSEGEGREGEENREEGMGRE